MLVLLRFDYSSQKKLYQILNFISNKLRKNLDNSQNKILLFFNIESANITGRKLQHFYTVKYDFFFIYFARK